MKECWEMNPKKRPSFKDILRFLDSMSAVEFANTPSSILFILFFGYFIFLILIFFFKFKKGRSFYSQQEGWQTAINNCVEVGNSLFKRQTILFRADQKMQEKLTQKEPLKDVG